GTRLQAFKLYQDKGDSCRRDTGHSAGLADSARPRLFKTVPRFHGEAGHTVIVEIFGYGQVFLRALPLDILTLCLNVTFVLDLDLHLLSSLRVVNSRTKQ